MRLLFAATLILFGSALALAAPPQVNKSGTHLLVDSLDERGRNQLAWTRTLVGENGYVKTLFGGITPETAGAQQGWKEFVAECYRLRLTPVIRLAGHYDGSKGYWIKPKADADGRYGAMAAAVKRVVSELPRSDDRDLYIEVWNEPNLDLEWTGKANLAEYARFFVDVAKAIRSIGDSRIKVMNGAFALSADATEECLKADPEFINSFDVWASHPYPQNHPPEYNIHSGTAKYEDFCIDGYIVETRVLEKYGRKDVKVMITETGWVLGNGLYESEGYPPINEYNRADYAARAFRDYYPQWPELMAVFPFLFSDPGWLPFNWVDPSSGTTEAGYPTKPHYQYVVVEKLAKAGDRNAAASGKILDAEFGLPLAGAKVSLSDATEQTDPTGAFYFGDMAPNRYDCTVSMDGFREQRRQVALAAGENAVIDMKLEASERGAIAGRVEDGMSEMEMEGAAVAVSPGDKEAVTDSSGRFRIEGLPALPFTLTASKEGFTTHILEDVRPVPGGDRTVTMRLAVSRDPAGKNMAGNPSFEQVGDPLKRPWQALRWETLEAGPAEVTDEHARSGLVSQCLRASGKPHAIRQITHYGTIEPGKKYAGGVWVKTVELSGNAWMSASFTDNGGGVIEEQVSSEKLTGSRGWTYLTVSGFAPQGSQRFSLNLRIDGASGSACFDDAFIGEAGGQMLRF